MKKLKYFIIISLMLVLFNEQSFSQEVAADKDYRFAVKTNPLSVIGGPLWALWIVPLSNEYKVSFEARTFEKQSVQVSVGYLGTSPIIKNLGDLGGDTTIKTFGYHGQLWYKFYLTKDKAPNGFYVGPHFSYAWAKIKSSVDNSKYFTASKLQFHVALGYEIITKGGFALDIFTGIGVKSKNYDFSHLGGDDTYKDWKLNDKFVVSVPFGLTFGYAF
ncbi:MAG: hypothetical protein NTZ85_14980 [Bacteroidia bacterium]|nr:hypothetical protein [Bacteroidia bacterium]